MSADTTQMQIWLDLAREGDADAWNRLIGAAGERLRVLAQQSLRADRLRSFEQTDDVLQQTLIRLHRRLGQNQPASVREFLAVAGIEMRRALIDLARHYFGPQGAGRQQYVPAGCGPGVSSILAAEPAGGPTPSQALCHREVGEQLYAAVERLPANWQELFSLLHFHQLTQAEAAALLDTSLSSVERMWVKIRVRLRRELDDDHR